jgi:hypothetical protein
MVTQRGLFWPGFPFFLSIFLAISQLLSVCPRTAREREANQGNLKLTGVAKNETSHPYGICI